MGQQLPANQFLVGLGEVGYFLHRVPEDLCHRAHASCFCTAPRSSTVARLYYVAKWYLTLIRTSSVFHGQMRSRAANAACPFRVVRINFLLSQGLTGSLSPRREAHPGSGHSG